MRSYSRWGIAAAGLFIVLCAVQITPDAAAQLSCMATYTCPAGSTQCAAAMGGAVTHAGPFNYASAAACASALNAANKFTIASCSCGEGTAAAGGTSTGSFTGDVLNLGANMWILQNVKNPYTAVFAQHFSQGFLTGLFGNNNSNPEAQRQQQLAYEAFQRQQQEAAERARIIEQQRIDAIFARLNSQLKLSGGLTQLALKTNGPLGELPMKLSGSGSSGGLQLKLGDASTSGSGIQGLPGLNIGGPANTADGTGGLQLKLGDSAAPEPAQPTASMGIPGLPGLNLDNVEPSQAAQLADTAANLPGPERSLVEDAALKAAGKDPALTAPSDDPFVTDYQKQAQEYEAAQQQNNEALQQASEAQGHVQADQAAMAYAKGQIDQGSATDQQKQAFAQMQIAEGSDEEAATAARQVFEGTQIHLSISRDNASGALAGLAPPPAGLAANAKTSQPSIAAVIPSRASGNSAATTVVLSPASKPQLLAVSPPPAGKPYVKTVSECVASYSPKGDVPSLEQLQKKLDSTMTAMEQIAKSQENSNDLAEEWKKELRDAHKDIFNNVSDAALDGLLDLSMKSLEQDKELYHEALEASMKESQQLRWEHQATAGFGAPNAIVEAKIADYLSRAKAQLGQRQVIEDEMAGVEKAQGALERYETRRDFRNWITDDELIPCKFANDGKINCDDFKENNGPNQFRKGDLNTQLDLLKQVIKFGMQNSGTFKALSYGSLIGETWDTTSFVIDTAYDGLAIAYSKRRLEQVSQDDAQLSKAREVLGDRIDRLNAEIGCYQRTSPAMAEDAR